MNLNNMTAQSLLSNVVRKFICPTSSPCEKTKLKRDEELLKSYPVGFLMCWNKANAVEVSNSLQSNDVIDDPTSKLTQFIYGALKSPTIRLLPPLHQDLSLLRRKSPTTHSGLRYSTTNSISCRLHFSLHRISSHVPELCSTVSTAPEFCSSSAACLSEGNFLALFSSSIASRISRDLVEQHSLHNRRDNDLQNRLYAAGVGPEHTM
ncbi:unnamed protein product [Schistosoma mattheei]|uniref:Uncharacterized protein n=1 Tax=Schistosoma mattheei TaxID=31246 RepID=A0A183P114_9TREM|nr:unnamed protein product [Schistosoma mattheei]